MNGNDDARRPNGPAHRDDDAAQDAIWRAGRMVTSPPQREATVGETRLGNVGRRLVGGVDDPEAEVYGEPKGPRPPRIEVLPKEVIDAPPAARTDAVRGEPKIDSGQHRYGSRAADTEKSEPARRAGFIPGGPSDSDN